MNNVVDAKNKIRLLIYKLKNEITENQKKQEAINVFEQIIKTKEFKEAKSILIYWSTDDELPTHKFIEEWCSKKKILLPSVYNEDIQLKKYTSSSEMKVGNLGIWEPKGDEIYQGDIDLVIVPGVAFDKNRNRLGRGKGFYDRFFENVNTTKWGVGFSFQLLNTIPTDSNDKSMNRIYCGTEIIE